MTSITFDDAFAEHPKVARLTDSAFAVWVAGIAYCSRNLTDGFIPAQVARGQLRYLNGNADAVAEELCTAGLWDQAQGGFDVHDYLDFQPSKADVLALREARIIAGRLGGKASSRAKDKHLLEQKPSKRQANSQATAYPGDEAAEEAELLPLGSKATPRSKPSTPSVSPSAQLELAAPNPTQALIAGFVDRSRELGSEPPSRVKGQVARLVGELVKEGVPAAQIAAGIELLLERRLHPATLPSLVHEAGLPRRVPASGSGAIGQKALEVASQLRREGR